MEAEIHDLDVELASLVESHDEVGAQGEAALQEVCRTEKSRIHYSDHPIDLNISILLLKEANSRM